MPSISLEVTLPPASLYLRWVIREWDWASLRIWRADAEDAWRLYAVRDGVTA
jgi:hypothetical protein